MDNIHNDMYNKAKTTYDERLKIVTKWEEVVPTLDAKCVVVMPWCEVEACEDDIKERSAKRWAHELGSTHHSNTTPQ